MVFKHTKDLVDVIEEEAKVKCINSYTFHNTYFF